MVEYDRQRMIKDSLLEQIMATAVETADAGRLLSAASGRNECRPRGEDDTDDCTSTSVLRAVLRGDGAGVREHWPEFIAWLAQQELLYVPLAKGGKPRRIVRPGRWPVDSRLVGMAAAAGTGPRNVPTARRRPDDGGRAPRRAGRGHRIRPALHLRLPGDCPLPGDVGRRLGRRARAGREL